MTSWVDLIALGTTHKEEDSRAEVHQRLDLLLVERVSSGIRMLVVTRITLPSLVHAHTGIWAAGAFEVKLSLAIGPPSVHCAMCLRTVCEI